MPEEKDKAINETDLFRWILVFMLANVYNPVNDKYRFHNNTLTRVNFIIWDRIPHNSINELIWYFNICHDSIKIGLMFMSFCHWGRMWLTAGWYEKLERKIKVFFTSYIVPPFFSKSPKEIFNVKGEWHSPNTRFTVRLPVITWHPQNPLLPPVIYLGMIWVALLVELLELSPKPSQHLWIKVFFFKTL